MAKYLKRGSNWKVSSDANADFHDALLPGNYTVKRDQYGNYFLEESPAFTLGRIYGTATKTADRILNTYLDRNCNTGVLAVGEKGTGKTMLARLISCRAAHEHAIPTLLVNENYAGNEFNTFLTDINQRAIVLFDEFEKVYSRDREGKGQEPLLTLLDGIHQSSNKLFLLTANNRFAVDAHFISRPGRIYYYLEYGALDREFIEEYCDENLADKNQIAAVIAAAEVYGNFSFDGLKALVAEMNRYDETPHAALKFLNIRSDNWGTDGKYKVTVTQDGVPIDSDRIDDDFIYLDFTKERDEIRIRNENAETDSRDNDDYVMVYINPESIVAVKGGGKIVVYRDREYEITATEVPKVQLDPRDSLTNGYIGGCQ